MPDAPSIIVPQRYSIPLRGSVAAGATAVLLSRRLDFRFRTLAFYLCFELNTNRTVTAEFFVSQDSGVDTTAGAQLGNSIFASFSPTLTLVGDEEALFFKHTIRSRSPIAFLKLRLINTDAFDHAVDSIVTVEELQED